MFTIKRICIFYLLLIAISSCLKIAADEKANNEISVSLDLSTSNPFYDELKKYYNEIELKYIRGENYSNGYGMEYFILERLSYYGIKNNVKYLLGYVTIDGVYDKNSSLLKRVVLPKNLINMGISSGTLDAPWGPSYAVKDTLKKRNKIGNTNPFVFLRIDFDNNSLRIFEPDY